MANAIPTPLMCPHGHGPGAADAQFCSTCGARLTAPSSPAPSETATPEFAPVGAPAAPAAPQSAVPVPPLQSASLPISAPAPSGHPAGCSLCGGDGSRMSSTEDTCLQCGWLRPLLPGYRLESKVFLWAQDGQAMARLQSLPPLHAVVRTVSDRVGRPWIESTFNGIRLGPKQLPDVWKQAILAARILGLIRMPDVYVAGDQMWTTYTYGTETNAFIVLGTAILNNFQGEELLFVLAREMGHCRAGHALWKTVTRFLAGDVSVHSGLLSQGLLHAISPSKLIEGAVDMPLMAWSRQSEITADRAGLLAVGDELLARRVLLAWSIRSARLLKQVNIDEWMKQEDASDDAMTRISEMTTSSSMYTTRRLRLLGQAAHEPELMRWSQTIQPVRKRLAPPSHPAKAASASPSAPPGQDSIRAWCTHCKTPVRIPLAVLQGKPFLNVRCPQCKNIFTLRPKPEAPEPAPAAAAIPASAPPAPDAPQP